MEQVYHASLRLLAIDGLAPCHRDIEPAQHIDGHEHSYRSNNLAITKRHDLESEKQLTQSQVRHIQLPQLNLLRVLEIAPAQIVRNARSGCNGRLDGVDEQVDRDLGIV